MEKTNASSISLIHLLGLQIPLGFAILLFIFFLLLYCVTICGNLLIITLVVYSKTLHTPMYLFLSQLSLSDILQTTNVVPNMLHSVLMKETIMSFSGCITQFSFLCLFGASECLLLTVMSYDRYLAICKPLHYNLSMNISFCWKMITMCWLLSVLVALILTLPLTPLHFCGPNIIDHFFCDFDPILKLSCSDTSIVVLEMTSVDFVFVVSPFFIIIVSYVYIIITIFKISSITGRQKVFSTCSSHLTVVCIYYGTLISVYLVPSRGQSWNVTKFLSLAYTVVTPLMNPIIYSLRNKELKTAIDKITRHRLLLVQCSCLDCCQIS